MAGEGTIQAPDQGALAARQSYMQLGADVQLGRVPAPDLQALASAVEGVRLPDYAAYDVGWLEAETGVSTFRAHPEGDWDEHFAPLTMLSRARERWERIYRNPASSAEFRSRAELAVGSLAVYETALSKVDIFRHEPLWTRQVSAAATLLREYDRRHNQDLTHELHCQTLMLLAGSFFYRTNLLMIPTPSRFQELGSDRRYEIHHCSIGEGEDFFYYLRVAALEGGILEDCLIIPPSMLNNEGYEPQAGHGTLRALLESINKKRPAREPLRMRHLERTYIGITKSIVEQTQVVRGLSLEADPVMGMDAAKQWYRELTPNYRVIEADKTAFETCINAHEYALGMESAEIEDIQRLGWLWIELSSLPGESDGFERGVQVFEEALQIAAEQENWPAYVKARVGIVTAGLYQELHAENRLSDEALATYRSELADIAEEMMSGFEATYSQSPYLPELQQLSRALAACLIINADPEADRIAVFPSPRQNASGENAVGSDVLVIPYMTDAYRPNAVGRLRFAGAARNTLDQGVANLDTAMLAKQGWHDDLSVLGSGIEEMSRLLTNQGQGTFKPDEALEQLRTHLVTQANVTMSI